MSLEITYLGHSGFLFDDGKHRVLVDPFLTGNPVAVQKPGDIHADFIALTHGHADHVGDTVAIAKRCDATVYGVFELCNFLEEQGVAKLEPGNPGGRIYTPFGYVSFVPAFHSSSYEGRYMGQPTGLVLNFKQAGVKVYHTGDTALYSDMKLIGEMVQPQVMCVCIGDRFTMGPKLASIAVDYVNPQVAIPIHYNTWPLIEQNPAELTPKSAKVRALKPGESMVWPAPGS